MKLYYFPVSVNSIKPLLVINHIGLQVDLSILDPEKGEHKEDWYLKLNPNGLAPTLVDGDLSLWDSNVVPVLPICPANVLSLKKVARPPRY